MRRAYTLRTCAVDGAPAAEAKPFCWISDGSPTTSSIAHNIHHVFQVVDRIVGMRLGWIVADALDPRTTSVAAVEWVITGIDEAVA